MDSSRRAVESYWRSRMIDGVTSDEDKVAPVYKLEEVCDLLRSSHVSIVKELSEFILKRLDHKSPVVKQKVLRLIKYSVGKSGVEFRREMQRHSAAIRQLFHYKGQLDPLKGDALNKAVRDTAHEALTAIFASEDSRPTSSEDINKRIQGFGNTNYEMPSEDKKSFLSEVVGLGSASIRQGFSNIASAHSLKKSDNGSYKSPNLRRSLTNEADMPERYEREEESRGTWGHLGSRNNVVGATYSQESRSSTSETENGGSVSHVMGKTREERLLESIVTSGGVRLQPTRDAIQAFLTEALKVDAMALRQALELKLQSPLWQVRMKAVCVLEAILRKKEDTHLSVIATYFTENPHAVVKCSETPQVTLREKANKVLALLDGEQTAAGGQQLNHKIEVIVTEMPDLIDTGDLDGDSAISKTDHTVGNTPNVARPLVDDLFGDSITASTSSSGNKNEDDPFADVSFHTSDEREQRVDLLFSGLDVDSKQDRDHSVDDIFSSFIIDASQNTTAPVNSSNYKSEMIELAGPVNILQSSEKKKDLNDLMGGSAANASTPQLGLDGPSDQAAPTQVSSGGMNSKFVPANMLQPNPLFSLENSTQFNVPPGFMFNPAFTSLSQNYNALGSVYAQQQLLAAMSNFQHLGHMTAVQGNNTVPGMRSSNGTEENSSPLPDIFHFANNLPQTPSSVPNSMKREETRAFDFISEHLSATRDSKRVS